MQYVKYPIATGFYWFRRPPYTKGFWWQKKVAVTPDWEMCFVNNAGMRGHFAVAVGKNTTFSFNTEGEWYGPVGKPNELYELTTDRADLRELQRRNLERASTN